MRVYVIHIRSQGGLDAYKPPIGCAMKDHIGGKRETKRNGAQSFRREENHRSLKKCIGYRILGCQPFKMKMWEVESGSSSKVDRAARTKGPSKFYGISRRIEGKPKPPPKLVIEINRG
ncbi:uncharacterized protein CIMG_13762 [Coccidioides immitis RS]|uniref:Uncharacterized protein n=1 Tax=Coccidioides immitis (strain RS) TaxID=246410 RepID=A0A0D8JWB8_COCIM|nr:uncharacterized protein CIMG_13762 [Coccidioides immitis RS]KJF61597.1 hypothetical protein CIMG_13762 [Coccidioides immitis RS]